MSALKRGFGGLSLACILALAALPSSASADACPNTEFRVGPSASLPDCRAYEQVTPVEKQGGFFEVERMGPGADGTFDVLTRSFAGIEGLANNDGIPGGTYSSERTGSGWSTVPLPLPATEYEAPGGEGKPEATSLDLRSSVWLARRYSQENRVDLYVSRPAGVIEDVGPVTPPGTHSASSARLILLGLEIGFAAASDDLSRILYETKPDHASGPPYWPFDSTEGNGLTGGPAEGSPSLYEYIGAGNSQPMLVGVGNDGRLVSNCGTVLGGLLANGEDITHVNAVSADAHALFFTALAAKGACTAGPPVDEVLARIDNGQPDARTVAISEPSQSDCGGCDTEAAVRQPARFVFASVDGSKAFFTTEQPLLGGDGTQNVYEYDFGAPAGERLVRVSGGDASVSSPSAEVEGVVKVSQDGSHVYFVARGVLTRSSNGWGQAAQVGANNLYVFERDSEHPAGRISFIADLSEGDEGMWQPRAEGLGVDVTPDGRFMVLETTDRLTPDDTSTAAQVFEYDARTGSMVRVSVGQNGYNDNGNTNAYGASIALSSSGDIYAESRSTYYWTGLSVSSDGSYVFFQSADGLTPQAFNHKALGQVYANNVYEYHDGQVYLISDGRDASLTPGGESNVRLLGTDEAGTDVFFTTVDPLVAQDADSNFDVYDARIDGGFPAPQSPSVCSGDGCQGALSPAPILLSPGSEFQAGGNPPMVAPAKTPTLKAKVKPKKRKAGRARKRKARRSVAGHRRVHRKGARS